MDYKQIQSDWFGKTSVYYAAISKRKSRLQQTTFINIFSLFSRENKT